MFDVASNWHLIEVNIDIINVSQKNEGHSWLNPGCRWSWSSAESELLRYLMSPEE
jgi:hypothetical protein